MTDDPLSARRAVQVDATIVGLLPNRRLIIREVEIDKHALRMSYEVWPQVSQVSQEDAKDALWLLGARDDRGLTYDDAGGAYGPAGDGTHTEGVRSVQPSPGPDVRWLDLFFGAPPDPEPFENPRHVLRVSLPDAS